MSQASVLVVEDEPDIAALYAGFIEENGYDVLVAETASEATETVDESIDAVLLDRRLPDGSGDDVLEHVRESGYDCRIAMVTAVEPDFDIIDMGFDLYLTKPVDREKLLGALDTLFARSKYDDLLQEAASLANKRAVIESEKSIAQLEANDAYESLLDRLEALDADIHDVGESFSSDDYRARSCVAHC